MRFSPSGAHARLLATFVQRFARALEVADSRKPVAGKFRPGIGPHGEDETVRLTVEAMVGGDGFSIARQVPYPNGPARKCDLHLVHGQDAARVALWIEAKLWRPLGDNGKPNDQIVSHIISPYAKHRSALTDCDKLASANLGDPASILLIGYEHDQWPMEPIVSALERLAGDRLSSRFQAGFSGLLHPVHARGHVCAWLVTPQAQRE